MTSAFQKAWQEFSESYRKRHGFPILVEAQDAFEAGYDAAIDAVQASDEALAAQGLPVPVAHDGPGWAYCDAPIGYLAGERSFCPRIAIPGFNQCTAHLTPQEAPHD